MCTEGSNCPYQGLIDDDNRCENCPYWKDEEIEAEGEE